MKAQNHNSRQLFTLFHKSLVIWKSDPDCPGRHSPNHLQSLASDNCRIFFMKNAFQSAHDALQTLKRSTIRQVLKNLYLKKLNIMLNRLLTFYVPNLFRKVKNYFFVVEPLRSGLTPYTSASYFFSSFMIFFFSGSGG